MNESKPCLAPYQQRVVEEFNALEIKLTNLKKFIDSSIEFKILDGLEKDLLITQYNIMCGYRNILDIRIKVFHANLNIIQGVPNA